MKKIVFLTGAAATGKSSVFQEFKKILSNDTYFQNSITRDFYKSCNITNEIELQKYNEKQKNEFQIKLLGFYVDYTLTKLNEINTDAIIDRSIIDYLAWTIYVSPNMTKLDYEFCISKVDLFFENVCKNYKCYLCEFQYPTPWSKDTETSDGFRYDPFTKNLILNYVISNEINNFLKRKDLNNLTYINSKHSDINNNIYTPEQRAKIILDLI